MNLEQLLAAVGPYVATEEKTFRSPAVNGYQLTAQWTHRTDEVPPAAAIKSVYQLTDGNPRQVWVVDVETEHSLPTRMLVTEHRADLREATKYSREVVLSLELIRNGVVLDEAEGKKWHQYPGILELLTNSKSPRLIAGLKPVVAQGPTPPGQKTRPSFLDSWLRGSLDRDYDVWLDWITEWEQNRNKAPLVCLCALLRHELFQHRTTKLFGCLDLLWANSARAKGRIIMLIALRAIRRLERNNK